jgi:hypothetical protein
MNDPDASASERIAKAEFDMKYVLEKAWLHSNPHLDASTVQSSKVDIITVSVHA